MIESFEALLKKAEDAHGHMCAGQILGVRMSLLGLQSLGIEDPLGADRKRLVVSLRLTDAPPMRSGWSLVADWESAPSNSATGERWPLPSSISPRAPAFALLRSKIRAILLASSILILKTKATSRCWPIAN